MKFREKLSEKKPIVVPHFFLKYRLKQRLFYKFLFKFINSTATCSAETRKEVFTSLPVNIIAI